VLDEAGSRGQDAWAADAAPHITQARKTIVTDATGDTPAGLEGFLAGVERRAYRIARAALWDHDQALDVVQDSMLRLVEKYAGRTESEWPALFFTILSNRINDVRRWRRVREGANRVLSVFGLGGADAADAETDQAPATTYREPVAATPGPDATLHARRQRTAIDAAVAGLPERQRQVFLLREWQEFSIKETAAILGCTEGTVKQHHFRALKALRENLAEVWNHEQSRSLS
jgi:RNA polymerase sigma-70 factor, ECF subfamily